MPKKKIEVVKTDDITDIISTFVNENGVEMVKKEYFSGKEKIREEIVNS